MHRVSQAGRDDDRSLAIERQVFSARLPLERRRACSRTTRVRSVQEDDCSSGDVADHARWNGAVYGIVDGQGAGLLCLVGQVEEKLAQDWSSVLDAATVTGGLLRGCGCWSTWGPATLGQT